VTLPLDRRLSVAPMMDWTDRHCRYFLRRLSRHTLLYTEMVAAPALLGKGAARALAHHFEERPLALQVGGDDPRELATCAVAAERAGFAEVNLNVGCPSPRVQRGRFGACLMRDPERVAEAVAAMRANVSIPVTVKHRIGVDEADRWEDLLAFVTTVAAGGCETFIVHARKAWLQGLSPKQNREVPPLRHELVHRLKRQLPHLTVVLNGGIGSLGQAEEHLAAVDGVMLGRAAYHDPFLLAEADRRIFREVAAPVPTRRQVIEAMLPYVESELAAGHSLPHLTRHLLGLYHGVPGGRRWRRRLGEEARRPGAGVDLLRAAVEEAEATGRAPRSMAGASTVDTPAASASA
jgi:tRNA-dihydrouridine synthase A